MQATRVEGCTSPRGQPTVTAQVTQKESATMDAPGALLPAPPLQASGTRSPSPRKKGNMAQVKVKRRKKEAAWVAQEKRLEVIPFLRIPKRKERICQEIDALVDREEAKGFGTLYTNAMTRKKQLHDEKIVLYSRAREFDVSEKERFSNLNVKLRALEKKYNKTKHQKEFLLREEYKEHVVKELKQKELGLEDIARSKNININEVKDIREKIQVLKIHVRNRVNYTFWENVNVLDRPDRYNYINRDFSHSQHLEKILEAENESMKLYKEIESLKKEIRRFDLHSVNVHKTEEEALAKIKEIDDEIEKQNYTMKMIDTRCRIVYRLIELADQLILDANKFMGEIGKSTNRDAS